MNKKDFNVYWAKFSASSEFKSSLLWLSSLRFFPIRNFAASPSKARIITPPITDKIIIKTLLSPSESGAVLAQQCENWKSESSEKQENPLIWSSSLQSNSWSSPNLIRNLVKFEAMPDTICWPLLPSRPDSHLQRLVVLINKKLWKFSLKHCSRKILIFRF